MKFVQYYLECLSQASYLIGDEATGRAAVVDPRRDIGEYLHDAEEAGLSIEFVIESHFHADFLSGHLELADATGATILLGASAAAHFPHRKVADGERISLGSVVLEFRATPGHTPESISVVVWEHADAAAPYGVLTGDTLFVGDVGRPDLAAGVEGSVEDAARELYHSVHTKLMTLPDSTRVFPAHGAGSACGKNLSTATASTIGEQRAGNYAVQPMSAAAFVALVTEGLSRVPDYFAHDAALNRASHALLTEDPPPMLSLTEAVARQRAGAVILDTRSSEAFSRGHLRGSVNVGLDGRFAEFVGMVIDPDSDVVVVCEPGSEAQSKIRLGRIGFDNVVGAIEESAAALATRPDLMEVASRLRVDQLRERMRSVPDLVVVDVRGPGERSLGAIEASVPIPIAALRSRLDELDPARPTVVYCAGGYRSSVAASVLRAHGFLDVSDLIGGYGAWLHSESGLVCHRVSPLNCETALTELIGGTVMPNARFYVRNHFETPTLDAESWRLEVRGAVDNPLRLSLRDLRRYPSRSAVVTLECAGNGRSTLVPPVDGEQWGLGAVSTAEWTGVPLGEVLDRAGVQASAREVVFRGADRGAAGTDDDIAFDRSLSLPDARDPDVLLAYAMNGEPLPLQHGYPLRLVVPRWYAVASVKWLAEIEVIEHAFQGHFQGDKYVYEWERGTGVVCEPVTTKRVRALILEPVADDVVEAGELVVRGVAWSGAAPIDRVEVMIGDGPPQTARLLGTPSASAWQWWELVTRAGDPGWVTIRARATDAAGNVQPDEPEWNRLGYGNNAVQQLSVLVRPGTPRPAAAR